MGFPSPFEDLLPFLFSWHLPQAEMEITRSCTSAVDVHRAFLFVFLPVHNSDAVTLNTNFIFPGGEGDVMGDIYICKLQSKLIKTNTNTD